MTSSSGAVQAFAGIWTPENPGFFRRRSRAVELLIGSIPIIKH